MKDYGDTFLWGACIAVLAVTGLTVLTCALTGIC